MATIVNTSDVELQATSPRTVAVPLPTSTTVNFSQVNGTTKPSNNADVTSAAVNAGVTTTSGGFTLSLGGAIKGGQTAYATGAGFFLGYASSDYRFSVGDSTNYFRWTGSALEVSASITAGGLTINGGGSVKGGQTDYATGTGFFLGYSGAAYKFSIGSAGSYLRWTGTALQLIGDISGASSIDISGSAKFNGQDGSTFAAGSFNQTGVGVAKYGVISYSADSTGGGVLGISTHATGTGVFGLYGEATSDNGYGVWAFHAGTGAALRVEGKMTISVKTLVSNLNAEFANSRKLGTIAAGASTCTMPLNNKPGANVANTWLRVDDTAGNLVGYIPIWAT